jgi:hypothetical protein
VLAHFAAYAALAYAFPRWALSIFLVGVAWEIGEAFVGVFQPIDIIANGLGVVAGATLARW